MSSIEKNKYFRIIENRWRKWSRYLFLSPKDMEIIEKWWMEEVPVALALEVIDEAFSGLFRKKRSTFFSLFSLRKKVEKRMQKRAEASVGKFSLSPSFQEEFPEIKDGEISGLFKKAMEAIRNNLWEKAEEMDSTITELLWKKASDNEKIEALKWAEAKLNKLKVEEKIKKDLILSGAKRRLREIKGIPFIF